MKIVNLMWDIKDTAPIDEIAEAVRELSGGTVIIEQVDTGLDSYEIQISATNANQQLNRDIAELGEELRKLNQARQNAINIAVELRQLADRIDPAC
jgi:DNA-binding transcriptional MerR regulator